MMSTKQDHKPGRGRPPIGDKAFKQTAFRFTEEQLAWLDAESEREGRVGRNAILRKLVDKARNPTK